MDRIDKRLRDLGYEDLWHWLAGHPELNWVEIGRELGFIPIAVMRKSAIEAPSFAAAVRQGILRELRQFFLDGWDPTNPWMRAKFAGKLFSEFSSPSRETRDLLMARLDAMPPGWRPTGVDDPDLVALTEGLFDVPSDAESRRS